MPAPTRTPRSHWIDAGLRALAAQGPTGVRVEVLAAELGVTKGGFYGQFSDRTGFVEELLETWERRSIDDVLAQVESAGQDPRDRIRRAGALTFGDDLLPIDLAIRSWARTDEAIAVRLRRVDNRRMEYLREQFSAYLDDPNEIEGRATLALALAIGQHFMAADHGARTRSEAVSIATSLLLAKH